MSEMLAFGRKVLHDQPFSRMLGTELTALEAGIAELSLPIRDDFLQQHDFVHGGVVSYLADNALTYAGGSVLGNVVTSEFKINYVRPAMGRRLVAKATVLHSGKRQAVCECKVTAFGDQGEVLVAVAQGTITKIDA